MMYFAVITDNLAAGLASTVFIAFLSALTSIRFTAVQYALFSSLMTLLPKLVVAIQVVSLMQQTTHFSLDLPL